LRSEFRAHRGLHVRSPQSDETAEIRAKVLAYPAGASKTGIARDLGISRMTVYRIMSAQGVSAPPVI
jgi:DNA invertase Pin-like site-specific DNA recombinase